MQGHHLARPVDGHKPCTALPHYKTPIKPLICALNLPMLTVVCSTLVSISLFCQQIKQGGGVKKEILLRFGHKVREERTKQGLSQEQLAELAGVHRTYIGMIERAEKNITLENIEKIAKALNISLSALMEF
jgi:DNA-binding XRE family transcriptional regulator